jgi:hypothetical protein
MKKLSVIVKFIFDVEQTTIIYPDLILGMEGYGITIGRAAET